jgi:predicted CXXCH cytochrome family protein
VLLLAVALPVVVVARPPKPTTATDPAGCTTAECHGNVKQAAFVHGPVATDGCDSCHRLVDPAAHTFQVWRQKADLCTFCHEWVTVPAGKPVVHKPVLAGECLGCHNPHGGPAKSLLREQSVAALCGRCHDSAAMKRQFVHKPVLDGDCRGCHQPHASRYPKLVDAAGTDLCLRCHKDFGAQLAKAKVRHKATERGCAECHDVHGSDFPKHVVSTLPDLCLRCHEEVKTDTAKATHKHPAVMSERACMSCHTAHAGDLDCLLSDLPIKVCMTCHKEPIKHQDGTSIAVPELVEASNFRHGPVRDGQCGGCHSIHGGDQPLLLLRTNSWRFYESYSEKNYQLCFSCHNPALARAEQAGAETGFRNGGLNLHYIHVNQERGRNCNVCHATHASRQPQLVRDAAPFGAWQLPITFSKTATGGTCKAACHADYAYDRLTPVARPHGQLAAPPPPAIAADPAEPLVARWSGKDQAGAEVCIPNPDWPVVLLFLRADQSPSEHVVRMVTAALRQVPSARAIVVLSGLRAADYAKSLTRGKRLPWPLVVDSEATLSGQLGVFSWPTTLVVGRDASVVAHVAGAPLSLTADLQTYLTFAAGQIDRAEMSRQLARRTVVSEGVDQQARWHLQMAQKLQAEGKTEEARAVLADGLKLAPTMTSLRVALVDVLVQLRQTEQASALLEQTARDAVPAWQYDLLAAKIAVAEGQWAQARRLLTPLLENRDELPEVHFLMGKVYEQASDWPNAANAYRAAHERSGN